MNHARTRRLTAGTVAMTLLAGLLTLFVMQPAQANHGDRTLQASPEVITVAANSVVTVTASLSSAPTAATGAIAIDAEIYGGPADVDGEGTPETPDKGCIVAVGNTTCTFTVAGSSGTSEIRLWIDHDNRNEIGQGGRTELDLTEDRLADGNPDFDLRAGSQQPEEADCRQPEDYSTAGLIENECGSALPPATGVPGGRPEPDVSDVISIIWAERESRAAL